MNTHIPLSNDVPIYNNLYFVKLQFSENLIYGVDITIL